MLSWQAIQTLANREQRVADELKRQHVDHYFPYVRRKHRWSDRNQWVTEPIFRTYLFARLDPDSVESRLSVLGVSGVLRIVGLVTEEEVDFTRQMIAAGGRLLEPAERQMLRLNPGDMVQVRCGPLAGMIGRLVRRRGKCRLIVEIQILGAATIADVGAQDVTLIQKGA